nr:hypothetical protein [Tanacetum cinerariifolium]
MSTQQDIYASGFESRPPMLNKENYVPWSSHLLRYAKSRPNGKLIHNSILNGPYVRKMIPEPGDANRDITEIWLRVQQMMKGSNIGIQEKKAKLFNEWERFTSNEGESIESYYHHFLKLMNDLKRIKHFLEKIASNLKFLNNLQPEWSRHNYLQQSMPNPEDITDPTTAMNMALALMAKAFKLNYSTPTNNNQRISSNPRNRQIAQPGQNAGIPAGYNDAIGNQVIQNAVENPRKEEAGIQLQAEEYDLMAAAADLDEIEEVNANCILMANLQQASTSGTQTDSTPVYDTDGSAEKRHCNLLKRSRDKMKQMNKEIKPANYTKINHLSGVFVPQKAVSREELYSSNNSKTANVSNSFLIPNEDLSNDSTPSVARKFLNDVKSTILTLQRVVKQRMTIETHNWASSAHQELHKIIRDEIFPIEAAKFVGDFKSLANEADASLAKHKELELEIKRLLKAVVKRFENCIVKKKTEYAKLWNDWYKKCDECKYDKISYDKAYNDMQQKIEQLQAQLGDLKGKSKDTSSVSDTRNPLSLKLENENVELEFQVLNYARENSHLKATYKNLFNSISVSLTSNSDSTPQESKSVNNDKVIAPGMFRINPSKTSRKEKHVPNTVSASSRTKPITVSQPHVITKKDVNSDLNGLSSTGVDNTKTRRPQPRSNTKNDRVPSASKSSRSKNKEAEVEEHYRNLLLSKNNKHMSSACNNIKTDSQEVISNVACVMWSPTGTLFNQEDKIVDSSESKSKSACSDGDNACTSNTMEPKIKQFPNSTSLLDRNLEGVDLLKGDRSTNLYTINLHEMASASPICLMARASSTKSWLWHQRLSHLNFDTINDLAINDLVAVPNLRQRLHLLHMDLCGPMRIAGINGKRYVLVIVDDYSRCTWVHFLRSKDEAPEAIATACFTQNRSIIHRRFNKTPYELINGKKPDISFLHVLGALCYPKNDREDIEKLGAKGDIADSCAYRVYNRRTKKIMKTMNVSFDEL